MLIWLINDSGKAPKIPYIKTYNYNQKTDP